MKGKKGTISTLTKIIIAIALMIVIILIVIKIRDQGSTIPALAPDQDNICVKKTQIETAMGKSPPDMDKDARDDSCDWCVCKEGAGCNNDADDNDGDKLPNICDKEPEKSAAIEFDNTKCASGKNLYKISAGSQCLPATISS